MRRYTVPSSPGCLISFAIFFILGGSFMLLVSSDAPPPAAWFAIGLGVLMLLSLLINVISDKKVEREYKRKLNSQAQFSSSSKANTTETGNNKSKNIPAITSPEQCYNQLICSLPSGGANILQVLRKEKNVVSMLPSSDDMCMHLFAQHPYRETLQVIHEYNPKAARDLSVMLVKLSHKQK